MSKKASRALATAAPGEVADGPRACPNCGGVAWLSTPVRVDKSNAQDQADRQAAIDKVVAERGEHQTCAGCGYHTHAGDALVPAQA